MAEYEYLFSDYRYEHQQKVWYHHILNRESGKVIVRKTKLPKQP